MDREGFRNRLKQYKEARGLNPLLKYWEWKTLPAEKEVPKYVGGGVVGEDNDTKPIGDIKLNYFSGIFSPLNTFVNKYATKKAKEIFGDLPISEIRKRLYNNLDPHIYTNVIGRLTQTVKNNEKENDNVGNNVRDDIFAEYLQIPHEERHETPFSFDKVVDSQYLPTIGKSDVKYKSLYGLLNPSRRHVKELISNLHYDTHHNLDYLPIGKNKLTHSLSLYFGEHTMGRLIDPNRGEYVSIYDLWDLAPFGGGNDLSNGIGKPVPFYDRLYLDDYYNVNSAPDEGDYYGGYLPEITVIPTEYADGGEVIGPPTYEEWLKDVNKYNPTIWDEYSMLVSLDEAQKAFGPAMRQLPGYDEIRARLYPSMVKPEPNIANFVEDTWENENPNNLGLKNGKYYPHKSPEGGSPTIGPGFKIDSGSHNITAKEAKRGVTKYRLDKELENVGKENLAAVNKFINNGLTTNPADTVSPQIKQGLMDLRYQVGPLGGWKELQKAVLEGDIHKIQEEAKVKWKDKGVMREDTRRNDLRNKKYFHY